MESLRKRTKTLGIVAPKLIDKLLCPLCRGDLSCAQAEIVECIRCKAVFPIAQERFVDFLTTEDRKRLQREIEFWQAHYQGKVYQDECEESYQRIMERMGVCESDEILEIGCGSGALLKRLPAKLKVGIEPVIGLLSATEGFDAVVGNAERLPFKDETFDLVYFKHSLHHVEIKELAIREALRITRPGGRLMVCEPNLLHPQRRAIANPNNVFRRWHILTRFMGPVETFQTEDEVVSLSEKYGGIWDSTHYYESLYDRLTLFQALQRIYSRVLKPVLSEKLLLPNYFILFRKAG